jgi:2-polyprenyl-3-methyl-5-hydroxy-6-metoxy-1,4-benzoquinol methylase
MSQSWEEANKWELEWHGNCVNSYNEETKQYIYAQYMGLNQYASNYYGQRGWDFGNKAILDMGCGPYSLLLKAKAKMKVGVDPCSYPVWVKLRYSSADVSVLKIKGEDLNIIEDLPVFDEVLMYNCLQHTENPEKICHNILAVSKIVRVFEWVDTGIADGHIQDLTEANLNAWLKGEGKVQFINQSPVVGKAYYGVFKGNHYEKV